MWTVSGIFCCGLRRSVGVLNYFALYVPFVLSTFSPYATYSQPIIYACINTVFHKFSQKYLPHTRERESGRWWGSSRAKYIKKKLSFHNYLCTQGKFFFSFSLSENPFNFFFISFLASKTKIFKNENFSLFFFIQLQKLHELSLVLVLLLKFLQWKNDWGIHMMAVSAFQLLYVVACREAFYCFQFF